MANPPRESRLFCGKTCDMNFLFHYMARWKAANWTRYHQLCVHLANRGHTIHVLQAPRLKSEETNFNEIQVDLPPNIHLHDVPVNEGLWNMRLPFRKLMAKGYYSWQSVPAVRRLIKEQAIDVLMLYNIPQYPLLKNPGCFTVFDIADDYPAMLAQELGWFTNPLIMGMGRRLFHSMIERSDCVLCVADSLIKTLPEHYRQKITLLPNGVSIAAVADNAGSVRIRNQYPHPIIGFIGSFEYFIDFDLIIEAAARLPAYTFLLVGGGRQTTSIKESLAARGIKNVVLTGPVPHQRINDYIGAMDICLNIFKPIPISHGACPIKLFEYLAMKKPVISTRLDEVKRIDNGFLLYADDADELTRVINDVISGKENMRERIERGFDTVVTRFDWQSITDQLLETIEEHMRSAH